MKKLGFSICYERKCLMPEKKNAFANFGMIEIVIKDWNALKVKINQLI